MATKRSAERQQLLDRYTEACNYPGVLDVAKVEVELAAYLRALGVERKIVRLEGGWVISDHPTLKRYVDDVLAKAFPSGLPDAMAAMDARDAMAAMDARAARDARAAMDARDAMAAMDARAARDARAAMDARDAVTSYQRFAAWCIQGGGWWGWRWEISWLACTFIGAKQLETAKPQEWSGPLFEAFCAGAWILHWTDDTLYWASKPAVHVECDPNGNRRLHNENFAALQSDVENLYFWHGVLVPAFVVVKPEWITVKHIQEEENAEVRRIMLERMGSERFAKEAKMVVLHEDELETNLPRTEEVEPGKRLLVGYEKRKEKARLLRCDAVLDGDGRPLKFVHVICPSTEREYFLRVAHDMERAYEAVGSTFHLTEKQYKSGKYIRQGDVMLLGGSDQVHA